jgi:Protein of unknown function (DUF3768)
MMTSVYTSKVQQLNDAFRKTITGGQPCLTSGVTALGETFTTKALALVRGFYVFTTENDPYGEHDFGSVTVDGTNLFWTSTTTTVRYGTAQAIRPILRKRRAC